MVADPLLSCNKNSIQESRVACLAGALKQTPSLLRQKPSYPAQHMCAWRLLLVLLARFLTLRILYLSCKYLMLLIAAFGRSGSRKLAVPEIVLSNSDRSWLFNDRLTLLRAHMAACGGCVVSHRAHGHLGCRDFERFQCLLIKQRTSQYLKASRLILKGFTGL